MSAPTPAPTMSDEVSAWARRAYARIPRSHALGNQLYVSGAVTGLLVDARGSLHARVRSSRRNRSYSVMGSLAGEGGQLVCTCVWGAACKHVAAALLAVMGGAHAVPLGSVATTAVATAADRWLSALALPAPMTGGERLAFRLFVTNDRAVVALASQRRTRAGWGTPQSLSGVRARRVIDGEMGERELLDAVDSVPWNTRGEAVLRGRRGATALAALISSDRLVLVGRHADVRIVQGQPIGGSLGWRQEGHEQVATISTDPPDVELLALAPLHYLDREKGIVGQVLVDGDVSLPMRWLAAPRVAGDQALAFAAELARLAPSAPRPKPQQVEVVRGAPKPVLRLAEHAAPGWGVEPHRYAELAFRYESVAVPSSERENPFVQVAGAKVTKVERLPDAEQAARDELSAYGLLFLVFPERPSLERWTASSRAEWLVFLSDGVPALREKGFQIEVDPSFKLEVVEAAEWFTDLEPSDNAWFDLEVGIRVGDERLSLLPLLVESLGRGGAPPEDFFLQLPDGRYVLVPHERIAPLADLILELAALAPKQRDYRLSRLRSLDLAAAVRDQSATLAGLRKLRAQLLTLSKARRLKLPRAFKAELRDYQTQGVAWLDLLGRAGLGAVLADDMGLGKTVQLIALLCARDAKRRGPSLIVAPTSVLLSWTEQLARFAPSLDVVLWHGTTRFGSRARLKTASVVLTSYAVLRRDAEELQKIDWEFCVLDEAQAIKNAKTVFAEEARKLRANQRIALTGTPMENHLGELWSIVSFALPGALGSEQAFRTAYRTPIEKARDMERLEGLRRRLAPVLLRRTKEQVASELPPKTMIEHPIELEEAQRDVYEAIRATVAKRVRDEIAKKGLARSQIMLLDALLKLRQVCCDPRLLKVSASKRKAPSAKLEAFEELITTLVGEGRKILVFSQFVEMLDLLSNALGSLHIEHCMLTGATRDRGRKVLEFQTGSARVFLISLKAGGTGLNLVEADTVIHYDPWWNPAVEAQATDRAHRIGQTKPVFVHRLIARGTVEEKIVALQAKKAELARGLLEGSGAFKIDAAAVEELLAPLPARYGS